METLLDYYGFSEFKKDESNYFKGSISYVQIKDDLYLVFDQGPAAVDLHFVQYNTPGQIGIASPVAANKLVENFDLSSKEHREIVQKYLDYN